MIEAAIEMFMTEAVLSEGPSPYSNKREWRVDPMTEAVVGVHPWIDFFVYVKCCTLYKSKNKYPYRLQ